MICREKRFIAILLILKDSEGVTVLAADPALRLRS
jgi:hypothetical protein